MTKTIPKKDDDSSHNNPEEKLKERGIYYITGEIEEGSLLEIQQDILLKHLDLEWKDDVQLIINSPGGEIYETWALLDLLAWIRMDVRTTGLGLCGSAGACLVACGTPGKRALAHNATMMIHGPYLEMGGNVPQLAANMSAAYKEYERDLRFWVRHSKYHTTEDIKKHFLNGIDTYLSADEAKKHGVIDHIIGYTNGPAEVKKPRAPRKKSIP
jgi:ATP-dependent Clp protease protease subunit